MNISYINILQTIESFASAHLQIKKFASDFPAQMPNFATKNEEYPILFVSPTNSIFQENTNRYEVDVYCFDIIQSDRDNINTILSDTNLILNDLNRWMLDGELFGIDNVSSSECTPIDNSLLDYAAGWVMRMTFETDTYGICEIPFSDSPVVITEVNNIVYSKYLTCETLSECPTIIDINNTLSGLTGTAITRTSQLINDGEDGTNPFIEDAPFSAVTYGRNNGEWVEISASTVGTVTSVGLSMPSAFSVSNSPIISAGTINVTATGTTNEFIKGDGTLGTTVTKTSELINDGDNGSTHFISLEDLPSNLILYATTAASDVGGYTKLVTSLTDPSYNTGATDVSTGAITGTDQFISALVSSPNLIIGNPGVFNITTVGNIRKTNGSGQAEFYFEAYKRTSGGTETLILRSANTQQITSAIYAEFFATGLWNDGIFVSTDRIVLKFYGTKVGGGSNPTYQFQFGGSNPVRTLVPIPLTVVPANGVISVSALTLTSVAATDLSSTVANPTTTPVITLNVPDASATARGVITISAQTLSGDKDFTSRVQAEGGFWYTESNVFKGQILPISGDTFYNVLTNKTHYFGMGNGVGVANVPNNLSVANGNFSILNQTASTIASFDISKNVVSLPLATYPNLDELKTLKGITTGTTIQSQIDATNVNVITITTTGSVTTDTTSGGYGQHGRHVKISNGANAINIECVSGSNANFVASYEKIGSGAITFTATLPVSIVQLTGTNQLTGVALVGSKACLSRNGDIYYLQITNY
jgi:hypothetical protein